MNPDRANVLLIDDDEDSYVITRGMLLQAEGAAIDLEWANTFEAGLAAIRGRVYDAYLVDCRLGPRDGLELLRTVIAEGCRSPIIMMTAQGEHAIDVQAMKEGAADYLVKGQLSGAVIERSIRFAIERARAAEKLLHDEAQLRILTKQVPAMLWTTDRQLRLTSSWGTGLLGQKLRPNEAVGEKLSHYFQSEDGDHVVVRNHRRALQGESVAFQTDWKGRKYRVQVNALQGTGKHLVGTVGIALDVTDAKQIEDEFQIARRIQEGLLPTRPPILPGFDIAGVCRPAAATGGDYFDFISMPGDCLGIVIADVSGHGFASALITMEMRRLLRTLVHWSSDLGEILTAADEALAEHPERNRKFVTLFFASLDPQLCTLTYTSAGHAAHLISASGVLETLESTGLPLGVQEGSAFPCRGPIKLVPGDLLLIFTDGFDEAYGRSKNLFGKQRVFETVQAHRDCSAAEIVEAAMRGVQNYCLPGDPQDDLTMVVLKVDREPTSA